MHFSVAKANLVSFTVSILQSASATNKKVRLESGFVLSHYHFILVNCLRWPNQCKYVFHTLSHEQVISNLLIRMGPRELVVVRTGSQN